MISGLVYPFLLWHRFPSNKPFTEILSQDMVVPTYLRENREASLKYKEGGRPASLNTISVHSVMLFTTVVVFAILMPDILCSNVWVTPHHPSRLFTLLGYPFSLVASRGTAAKCSEAPGEPQRKFKYLKKKNYGQKYMLTHRLYSNGKSL